MDTIRPDTGKLNHPDLLYSIENVSKTYQAGYNGNADALTVALKNVNLTIHHGEFLVIMGESGSGKSTLLHLMGGLDLPNQGTINFSPRLTSSPQRKQPPLARRLLTHTKNFLFQPLSLFTNHPGNVNTGNVKKQKPFNHMKENHRSRIRASFIGMIYQSFHLIPTLSALENVELPLLIKGIPRKHRILKAKELLTELGLEKRMTHLPRQLSGGEQQRVAIARALVMNPQVLLADEPTGNLDSHAERDILEQLKRLREKRRLTIILVTHSTSIREQCAQRHIHMKDGQILVPGQTGGLR